MKAIVNYDLFLSNSQQGLSTYLKLMLLLMYIQLKCYFGMDTFFAGSVDWLLSFSYQTANYSPGSVFCFLYLPELT